MPEKTAGRMGASLESAELLRGIRKNMPFLEELAVKDLEELGERIVARAKELAPVGSAEEGDPHPGELRDDIGIKGRGVDSKGPYIDVGTTVEEGFFQEFGTHDQPPQPFMRPAIAEEGGR